MTYTPGGRCKASRTRDAGAVAARSRRGRGAWSLLRLFSLRIRCSCGVDRSRVRKMEKWLLLPRSRLPRGAGWLLARFTGTLRTSVQAGNLMFSSIRERRSIWRRKKNLPRPHSFLRACPWMCPSAVSERSAPRFFLLSSHKKKRAYKNAKFTPPAHEFYLGAAVGLRTSPPCVALSRWFKQDPS